MKIKPHNSLAISNSSDRFHRINDTVVYVDSGLVFVDIMSKTFSVFQLDLEKRKLELAMTNDDYDFFFRCKDYDMDIEKWFGWVK